MKNNIQRIFYIILILVLLEHIQLTYCLTKFVDIDMVLLISRLLTLSVVILLFKGATLLNELTIVRWEVPMIENEYQEQKISEIKAPSGYIFTLDEVKYDNTKPDEVTLILKLEKKNNEQDI